MNEAVFISDLHLHPQQPEITERFFKFLDWAKNNTQNLYILGDFFHVWVGDDLVTEFELDILRRLLDLHHLGINVYFMPGNRDFLIEQAFLKQAEVTLLPDPSVVCLKGIRIFLTHGDAYCLHDKAHQWLRKISRPRLLKKMFLAFPRRIRARIVTKVRRLSHNKKMMHPINSFKYQLVKSKLYADMHKYGVMSVIYGHIHRPGTQQTSWNQMFMKEYVLSDWDDDPHIICYNLQEGLNLVKFS